LADALPDFAAIHGGRVPAAAVAAAASEDRKDLLFKGASFG
jgi:hypothetical protein